MTIDREQYIHLPISKCPIGTTGYAPGPKGYPTCEQFLNELMEESDIQIIDAAEFLATIEVPATYSLPRTLNTLDWWKVFNQGAIGSCFGCSDAQTATGVHWLKTGERVEFSKFGHYIATQKMGGMLGRDDGSMPTDGVKVAAKWGYCPEVWSEHLESLYKAEYGEPSGFKVGERLAPAYPKSYRTGLTAFKPWLDAVLKEGSKIRKVMHLFRMKQYLRIKNQAEIVEAKRKGAGFVQQSSYWSESFDANPKRIDRISGGLHPRHGGHAYQILDITPDGECVLGNTWGQQWGDDGAKVIAKSAEDEVLRNNYTLCFLKTDMEFTPNVKRLPRVIPIRSGDWV